MFCPKCGTQANDNATFCAICGANISSAQPNTDPTQNSGPYGGSYNNYSQQNNQYGQSYDNYSQQNNQYGQPYNNYSQQNDPYGGSYNNYSQQNDPYGQSYNNYSQQNNYPGQQRQTQYSGPANSFTRVRKYCGHPLVACAAALMTVLAIWRLVDFFKSLESLDNFIDLIGRVDNGLYAFVYILEIIAMFLMPIASVLMACGAWLLFAGGTMGDMLKSHKSCGVLRAGLYARIANLSAGIVAVIIIFIDVMESIGDSYRYNEVHDEAIFMFLLLIFVCVMLMISMGLLATLVSKLRNNITKVRFDPNDNMLYSHGGGSVATFFVSTVVLLIITVAVAGNRLGISVSVVAKAFDVGAILELCTYGVTAAVAGIFRSKMTSDGYTGNTYGTMY